MRQVETSQELCLNFYLENKKKMDQVLWDKMFQKSPDGRISRKQEALVYKVVYFNGVEQEIRAKVKKKDKI